MDAQIPQLLQLNGGALLAAAGVAGALAAAAGGRWGGLSSESAGAGRSEDSLSFDHPRLSLCRISPAAMALVTSPHSNPANFLPFLPSPSADLLRVALAGQGLANCLLFLYYWRTIHAWSLPLELATNGLALALPAADLLSRGYSLQARGCLWVCACFHLWEQRDQVLRFPDAATS